MNDFLSGVKITNLFEEFGNKSFLKSLIESPSFQSTKIILETASAASVNSKEMLYVGRITNNRPMQYTFLGESANNGVQVIVENNITIPISSLFHNHYNKAVTTNTTDVRLLGTFSPADVVNFFTLKNSNQIQNLDTFNLILVTPDQKLQAIMIDNQAIFNERLLLMQQGVFQDKIDFYESLIMKEYNDLEKLIDSNISSTLAAQRLHKILTEYGLGIYVFDTVKNKWVRP